MRRTLELWDTTVVVVRQIAAVGPIVQMEKQETDDEGDPIGPPKRWCTFTIVLVGGTKLYPQIEYPDDRAEAERDRSNILAEIETTQQGL